MKLINQSWEWVQKPESPLQIIEKAGRTCYKSEGRITPDSSEKFAISIMNRGHESVIEHVSASVKFITNRGVTHELVRHRLCAFSQESTRYVNYKGGMEFIVPVWLKNEIKESPVCIDYEEGKKLDKLHNGSFMCGNLEIKTGELWCWLSCLRQCEEQYKNLIDQGWRPEQAREVLPNSLKTEIVVTANLREWRHIFKLRTAKAAHPQIRELMLDCVNNGFKKVISVLFDEFGGE